MLQDAHYHGCQTQRRLWQIKLTFSCEINEDDVHQVRRSRPGLAWYGYVSISLGEICGLVQRVCPSGAVSMLAS